MTRTSFIPALALVLALSGGSVEAADRVAPAAERDSRALFERGEAHFRAGLFAEALAEYQAGYDLNPLPGFLINIAQCHRRLGHLDQALVTYRKFVMVAPDSRFVPQVRQLIGELEALVKAAAEEKRTDPSAAGAAAATEPTLPPSLVGPPVTAPGLLAASARPPEPARARTRWWLWGTIAAGVAGAAVATFLVLRSPETTTLHDGTLGTLRR